MINEIEGIDVHAHGVPREFLEGLQRIPLANVEVEHIEDRYVLTFPGVRSLRPIASAMLNFEKRRTWLDEYLMAKQIVSPWLDIHGQQLNESDGQEWVRRLNDAMAAEVDETSGRMRAYATLHLANCEAAVKELDRAASSLSMVGAMIPTHLPVGKLTDDRYDALWQAAEALRMPIVLHPPTVAPSNELFKDYPESGVFGRAIETTIIAAQMIVTGVFDRFPNLKIVLVHGGGFLPYQAERLKGEAPMVNWKNDGNESHKGLELPITDYLRAFHYDTVLMSPASLRLLLEVAGTKQVMIGSDYGARPNHPCPSLVRSLESVDLAKSDEADVLHNNAEQLFAIN